MLEKNKDYFEMRVSSTDCAFTQNASTTISIKGFSYDTSFRLPDPGESYVIISKEKFEKLQESVAYYMVLSTRAQYWKDKCEQLQADDQHYRELAKQFEENYNLLLEKTGFTSVVDLIDYICDPSMTSPEDKTLKEIIDECEKDYISERDKAEALEKEIGVYSRTLNEWKEGTGCPSPSAAKNVIDSTESWHQAYRDVKATNEKLADNVKSWQKATGYSTPESYLAARINNTTPFDYTAACQIATEQLCCGRDLRHNLQVDLEYYRALSSAQAKSIYSWREATGCDTPDEAKSRIEGLENAVRLTNKNMIKEIEGTIDEWQKATGCVSPGKAERKITDLYSRIDKMKEAASIASNWIDKIVEG